MTHDEDVAQRPVARTPDFRAVGDRALLLEVDGLPAAMAWHRALTREPLPGQIEAVAAARTVLLRFESDTAAEAARTSLRTPPGKQWGPPGGTLSTSSTTGRTWTRRRSFWG
jgi:hypothetical protein